MSAEVGGFEKKYPKNWVVMQNRILEAYRSMSLDAKRLIILASPIARMIDATQNDAIEISAIEYAKACNISVDSAYSQLDAATKDLLNSSFFYKNSKGKRVGASWVIRAIYDEGYISICFTDEVLLLLKIFDENNPFTKYRKDDVLKLRREYSIDMYHIAKKHEKMRSFVYSLDDIRQELALPKSYQILHNLKKRVIEPAIEEINQKTDINLSYENVKRGRTVTGLKFTVKAKLKRKNENTPPTLDNNSAQPLRPLKGKQLSLFAKRLSEDHVFGSKYGGNCKSHEELAVRLMNELHEVDKVNEYREDLIRVGFDPIYLKNT